MDDPYDSTSRTQIFKSYSVYHRSNNSSIVNVSLHYSGTLVDEASLEIISAGFDVGNTASIIIDDTDHAAPSRGFNIAVYDYEDSMILDSCCIDTFTGDYGQAEGEVFGMT